MHVVVDVQLYGHSLQVNGTKVIFFWLKAYLLRYLEVEHKIFEK